MHFSDVENTGETYFVEKPKSIYGTSFGKVTVYIYISQPPVRMTCSNKIYQPTTAASLHPPVLRRRNTEAFEYYICIESLHGQILLLGGSLNSKREQITITVTPDPNVIEKEPTNEEDDGGDDDDQIKKMYTNLDGRTRHS